MEEGERKIIDEAQHRRDQVWVLRELATLLSSNYEYEEGLAEALALLVEHTAAYYAIVLVKGNDEQTLTIMSSNDDPCALRLSVPNASSPAAVLVLQGGGEITMGGTSEDEATLVLPEVLRERGLSRCWGLPLKWEGEVYGVLELGFDEDLPLSEVAADLVRQASDFISCSLRHSEAYKGLNEQTRKKPLVGPANQRQLEVLQQYEDFFQRAFNGIIVLNREHLVLHLNPAGEQITGYARRGLLGRRLDEIVEDESQERLSSVLEDVSARGSTQSFDLQLITTSGDHIVVSVSPSALLADDTLIVLSFRDVSEAWALENELRSTKDFLERLIGSAVYAIVATDLAGKLIIFNNGAERLFGHKGSEVIGRLSIADLFPEGAAEVLLEELRMSKEGGAMEGARKEAINAQKELIPVVLSANLLFEESREVGMVIIFQDMREQLHIERRLAQAQEKLLETEKQALIAELAGTTAHELNQPLTSIMGYAQLLLRRMASDDSNYRSVETILAEAERMAEIVRKIGKITRYETKAYVGETQILDLEKSTG